MNAASTLVDAGSSDGAGEAAAGRVSLGAMRSTRLAALALVFLSPLVGEYLLGNITIRDLLAIPFLAPMYGGGALLIREVSRRTGRGRPTVLVLGLAYGLIEPGVFDGSLFSSMYEGVDYSGARIPVLGVSAYYGLQFAVNHAVWSITIPILLVESLAPRHSTTPWLGRPGLALSAAAYVLGGLLIREDMIGAGEYHVTLLQAAGVLLVALILVIVAFRLPRRAPAEGAGRVPRPWLVGVAGFVVSAGYFVLPADRFGVAASVTIVAGTAWMVATLSRRAGWRARHRLALATGALATYAGAAFAVTSLKHHADPVAFAGNGVFALAAAVLSAVALGRADCAEDDSGGTFSRRRRNAAGEPAAPAG